MTRGLAQAAAILWLAAGEAAADAGVADVTANIRGVCRIESIHAVDFGELEEGGAASERSATGTVRFWCTKGVAYTIALGSGANPAGTTRRMMGQEDATVARFLPYELAFRSAANGTGLGPHAPEALALHGTVRVADYKALAPGEFRDTVMVTITAAACCASVGTIDSYGSRR